MNFCFNVQASESNKVSLIATLFATSAASPTSQRRKSANDTIETDFMFALFIQQQVERLVVKLI